jgi:protein-ribulosamine 3-kinase
MDLQAILDDCALPSATYASVSGGDINTAFVLTDKDGKYFLKVNDAAKFPNMFITESNGLKALSKSQFRIPEVVKCGIADGKQYLLLEWVDSGRPASDFWETFGTSLANLHLLEQSSFGWVENNYIGSLVQHNDRCEDWATFFSEQRIMPLVKFLRDANHYSTAEVTVAERFCRKAGNLFPVEEPCLLHGDLWSGNFVTDTKNMPVLIDPSVYSGHREIDIGMTKLFGGFDDIFYEAYHDTFPLEKGWQHRLPFSQFYPLLVHAVLFGGSYVSQTLSILKRI